MIIRPMNEKDPDLIAQAERAQGWHATADKYIMRLQDEKDGKCRTFVADAEGMPVGYVHLYFPCLDGPFAGQHIPEIVDFGVLETYRRKGIGTALMDAAEHAARQLSHTVCLGVGLHAGYGAAQKMYVKRGYVPDGSGVWYGNNPCPPYEPCVNDDDLVLYFIKEL